MYNNLISTNSWKCTLLLVSLFVLLAFKTTAYHTERDSTKSLNIAVLPLVYFTPETSWAFGAGTALTFRFKDEPTTSRLSQIQVGGAYTLFDQILTFASYRLFIDNNKYNIYGELGYYKYIYDFYGVGNEQPQEFREVYEVKFPRFRLNALRQIVPNLYVGIRYWYDHFQDLRLDPNGQLALDNITGFEGGVVSQAGIVVNYDSRNNVIYPTQGTLIELVWAENSSLLGSHFDFSRFRLDARGYLELNTNHVFAIQLYSDFVNGDPPFNEMALLGGSRQLRGYYEGRYRDNNLVLLQAEYRLAPFQNITHAKWKWLKRIKVAAFGGFGNVAPAINQFEKSNFRYAVGGGLRIGLTESGINLRIDYGFGQQSSGLYFTIGEAF